MGDWGDCVWRFWGILGLVVCMDEFGRGAYLGDAGGCCKGWCMRVSLRGEDERGSSVLVLWRIGIGGGRKGGRSKARMLRDSCVV